jgi:hypothetical protein
MTFEQAKGMAEAGMKIRREGWDKNRFAFYQAGVIIRPDEGRHTAIQRVQDKPIYVTGRLCLFADYGESASIQDGWEPTERDRTCFDWEALR